MILLLSGEGHRESRKTEVPRAPPAPLLSGGQPLQQPVGGGGGGGRGWSAAARPGLPAAAGGGVGRGGVRGRGVGGGLPPLHGRGPGRDRGDLRQHLRPGQALQQGVTPPVRGGGGPRQA